MEPQIVGLHGWLFQAFLLGQRYPPGCVPLYTICATLLGMTREEYEAEMLQLFAEGLAEDKVRTAFLRDKALRTIHGGT